jgi:hypothetical protein
MSGLAARRKGLNRRDAIEEALRYLAPKIPRHEFDSVVDHALDSIGLATAAPGTAAWLSLVAYVRHVLTEYDALLAEGYDVESARHFVADVIDGVLQGWGARRRLASGEE